MSIIDSIRIKLGKLSLKKELQNQIPRKVITTNLDEANSIAILYKIETEEDYVKVNKFVKYLKQEFGTKKIFFLGYWDDAKNEPTFLQARLDFDYFTKKQLNWKGIPIGGNIENFLNEKFDILIDLNNYYNIPLRYLLLKSNSNLRVGRYNEENEPFFDIMISDNDESFEEFCNQLVKYLSMLKG